MRKTERGFSGGTKTLPPFTIEGDHASGAIVGNFKKLKCFSGSQEPTTNMSEAYNLAKCAAKDWNNFPDNKLQEFKRLLLGSGSFSGLSTADHDQKKLKVGGFQQLCEGGRVTFLLVSPIYCYTRKAWGDQQLMGVSITKDGRVYHPMLQPGKPI